MHERPAPPPGHRYLGSTQDMLLVARIMREHAKVAALLKGQDLDMPPEWTDAQIINRVYRHFGPNAGIFLNDEWVRFVKSLFAQKTDG